MHDRDITEEDIIRRVDAEITDALGWGDKISAQRATAMSYYYGEPLGNEHRTRQH